MGGFDYDYSNNVQNFVVAYGADLRSWNPGGAVSSRRGDFLPGYAGRLFETAETQIPESADKGWRIRQADMGWGYRSFALVLLFRGDSLFLRVFLLVLHD